MRFQDVFSSFSKVRKNEQNISLDLNKIDSRIALFLTHMNSYVSSQEPGKTRLFHNHTNKGPAKGQLISKCPFGVIIWTKIPTKLFPRFLP